MGTFERYKSKFLRDLADDEANARAGWDAAWDQHQAVKKANEKLTTISTSADSNPPSRPYYRDVLRDFIRLRDVEKVRAPVQTICEQYDKTTKWFRKNFAPWSTKSDK
jgi:hypothetical protein